MAQSISLGVTPFVVGTQQFLVDGLPVNSEGFELVLGIGASWRATNPAPLFTLELEIALDGVTFQQWARFTAQGGDVRTPMGTPLDAFSIKGMWPGEHDGSANPMGRRKLRATDLRATLTVHQAFTAQSVLLRTI